MHMRKVFLWRRLGLFRSYLWRLSGKKNPSLKNLFLDYQVLENINISYLLVVIISLFLFFLKTCPLPCENNKDCVQCKVFGTGKKATSKFDCDQCDIELTEVYRVESDPNNKICQFNDLTDNCTFIFSYDILNDKKIKYQKEKGIIYNVQLSLEHKIT